MYANACADETMRAKVPLLEVGGSALLIESAVICEFLEELAPGDNPPSAADKATARLFATLAQPTLSFVPILQANIGSEQEAKEVASLVERLRALDQFLIRYAAGQGPFLLGESFSLAECSLAPFVQRLVAVLPGLRPQINPLALLEEAGLARLGRWMQAVTQRESCVATLPPTQELVDSYAKLIERMRTAAA